MERHHFEAELQNLRNQLLTMGGLVEERGNVTLKGKSAPVPVFALKIGSAGTA